MLMRRDQNGSPTSQVRLPILCIPYNYSTLVLENRFASKKHGSRGSFKQSIGCLVVSGAEGKMGLDLDHADYEMR
jgi:hypothetical protein